MDTLWTYSWYALIVIWLVVLLALAISLIMGFFIVWGDSDWGLGGKAVATIGLFFLAWLLGIVTFLTIGALGGFEGTDGQHEWRGGTGPNTVCYYEERSEYNAATKTTDQVTYTVCRDQPR